MIKVLFICHGNIKSITTRSTKTELTESMSTIIIVLSVIAHMPSIYYMLHLAQMI